MATNRARVEGRKLSVAVGSTIVSGDPVIVGSMPGVALTDYDADSGEATVDFGGVYNLSVKGVDNAGNVAVALGDALYYVTGDTPVLSKKASGVFFGYALEEVVSSETTTIMVRIPGMGNTRAGFYGAGVAISNEVTGNGSAQNYAHGLGSVPSKVLVIPTEFASNINFDVAEGSHDATNAIVTVTTGAKYRVLVFK